MICSILKSHGQPIVHFNFRAGSTFPVPVCTVPHLHWVNKSTGLAGATRLTRSDFMLHIGADLLLLKGQRCVIINTIAMMIFYNLFYLYSVFNSSMIIIAMILSKIRVIIIKFLVLWIFKASTIYQFPHDFCQ